jgi:tetratricopeptide (TPR) repeat protein/predicted Ser/Thr protein kinase
VSHETTTWGDQDGASPGPGDAPSPDTLRRGTTLGRYVLVDPLGRGGMGTVYSAWDTQLKRRIALKVVHRFEGDAALEHALAEARALAKVRHPNVVAIHEVAREGDMVFLAMTQVEGPRLREWATTASRPDLLAVLGQCGRGLAAIHRAGLAHRDFKPDNVVVESGPTGPQAIVIDFGLATATSSHETTSQPPATDGVVPTGEGRMWAGTPAYMAPECFEDDAGGSVAADQWAFALSWVELLTGQRPSRAACDSGALAISDARLRRPLARALATDPAARWPDLDALVDALGAARGRPRSRRLVVGALAVASAASVWAWRGAPSCERQAIDAAAQTWNDATRRDLQPALASLEPTAAEHLLQDVDAWSSEWTDAYAQTCAAEQLEAAAGWCLQDSRASVSALLQLASSSADARSVVGLSGVLPRLSSPASCRDESLASQPQPSAEDRQRFATARTLAERARVHELAGQLDEAAELIAAAWQQTEDAPALVRAPMALRRASVFQRQGDLAAAATTGVAAMKLAAEAGDDALVALTSLVHAETLTKQAKGDALQQHLEYAEIAVARAPTSPRLEALLHFARGRAFEIGGDPASSLASHERALAIREADVPGSVYVADARVNVAVALGELGELDEALAQITEAAAEYEAHFGPRHPTLGHVCVVKGLQLSRLGRIDEAQATLTGCIALVEAATGNDDDDIAFASTLQGMLYAQGGDYPTARPAFERALAVRLRTRGPDHPETAIAHTNLANILSALGQIDDAREHLDAAQRIVAASFGPTSVRMAGVLSGRAQLEAANGDAEEAARLYERSLDIESKAHGEHNPGLVTGLLNLGELQATTGDERAEATYLRAEAILERAGIAEHPLAPVLDVAVADLRLAADDPDAALVRYERGLQAEAEPVPGLKARARFGRARVWGRSPARRDEARAEAEAARDAASEAGEEALQAKIAAWLDAR